MSEGYETDMVLIGLTRPPMIKGVGINWMFLNIVVTAMLFALTGSVLAAILFPLLHGLGVIIYAKDVSAVSIIGKRLKVGWTINRAKWGGNSYNG